MTIAIPGRPPLMNRERAEHWRLHREATRVYRRAAQVLAQAQHRSPLDLPVEVVCWPRYPNRRSLPDVGAWAPALKAAIDGIVDAGLLPDDGPDVVRRVTHLAPRIGGTEQLVVVVRTVDPSQVTR